MTTPKSSKKIKDNITLKEFKHLMNYLETDPRIRELRKSRLQKIFSLLYTTGLRVNETTQVNEQIIKDLFSNNKAKIFSSKQNKEKYIYIRRKDKKLLEKYFSPSKGYKIQSERKQKTMSNLGIIRDVNTYLKKVFPNKNITSHSFRQTLITDLANKQINPSVIQHLISHKNIATTLGYVKPSEDDILNALENRG